MTAYAVTQTIKDPGGVVVPGVQVFVRLVASDTDPDAPGHVPTADYTIGDVKKTTTNASGIWTMTLEANATISPASTVYSITYRWPGSRSLSDPIYITVTAAGRVEDMLTDAPSSVATSALQNHLDDTTAAHAASAISFTPDNSAEWGATAPTELDAATEALVARSVAQRISMLTFYGHSFGSQVVSLNEYLYHRRVADQLGAVSHNRHISSAKLLSLATTSGCFGAPLQYDPPENYPYGAQSYPGRPGAAVLMWGINDIQTWANDADKVQLQAAMIHCLRALISWLSCSAWFLHSESSTGQTFAGSGSWASTAYVAGLEAGPGASRNRNTSSGATYSVLTSTAMAGKKATLFFLTNYTGGSAACSSISITLDGAAYSTIDTRTINPATVAVSGIACARVTLPDDGATHTILATAGSGGMEVMGYGVEAPRPIIVANVARRSDAGYTPNGSDAIVLAFNTALTTMVAEFGSPVVIADIYTALSTTSANFGDGLHPNAKGHELIAREILQKLEVLSLTAQQAGMV